MFRSSKTGKKSVELDSAPRPSRIRRDPATIAKPADAEKKAHWRSDEWEIWLAVFGIIAFALAINIVTLAISAYTQ